MTDPDADLHSRQPVDDATEAIASATCEMGELVLFADRLSFRGSPLQERLGQGQPDREIALRRVVAIEFRTPTFWRMGRLGLVLDEETGRASGRSDAPFVFQTWERPAFESFRVELEKSVAAARSRASAVEPGADGAGPAPSTAQGAPPAAAPSAPGIDIPDQIRRLAALRDDGFITAEEFEVKKRDLLTRM